MTTSEPTQRLLEQRELALQVESCSPRLLRLARHSALGGCGLSAGVLAAGPVPRVYSSVSRRIAVRCPRVGRRLRSLASAPLHPSRTRGSLSVLRTSNLLQAGGGSRERRDSNARPPLRAGISTFELSGYIGAVFLLDDFARAPRAASPERGAGPPRRPAAAVAHAPAAAANVTERPSASPSTTISCSAPRTSLFSRTTTRPAP